MTLKKKILITSAILIPIGVIAVILIKSPVPIHNDIDNSFYDTLDVAKEMYDDLEFYNLTHDASGLLNEYGRSLM